MKQTKTRNGDFVRTIAVVLGARRKARGISQVKLAVLAGVSTDSVARAEQKGVASIETICRYAAVLGTTASSIILEVEERLRLKAERAAAVAQMQRAHEAS